MSKLERRQTAIWYRENDDEARIHRRLGLHYVSMFSQDLGQQIIPSGIDRDWGIDLAVESAHPNAEKILARGFDISRGHGYSRSLAYPLHQFTRLTTAELCDHPRATYEIAYLYAPGQDRPEGFELFHLPAHQLRRFFGRVSQVVPAEVARERKCARRIPLPAENLAVFELPGPLQRKLERAMTTYEGLSIGHLSTMARASIEGQTPYHFSSHHQSLQLSLMEAARLTGWDARGSYREKVLSSYWLKQHVEHLRFSLRIREALMAQINDVVRRAGQKIGFAAEIRLSGFYSDTDLDAIHRLIDEGKTSFVEIVDKLSMYPNRKVDTTTEDFGEVEPDSDEAG